MILVKSRMETFEDHELGRLAQQVDKILKEELKKSNIETDMGEVRVYTFGSVGVQGDGRSYKSPAEITLFKGGKFIWTPEVEVEFIERLSARITNEVKDINRVMYVTAIKED